MIALRFATLSAILLVLLQNDASMATDMEVSVLGQVREVEIGGAVSEPAQPPKPKNENKTWPRTKHTLDDYVVAGYNLADYYGVSDVRKIDENAAPFELFEDFDISGVVTGNENWDEMVAHRRRVERPSLSFYTDKVARKRWLPVMGYEQPKPYALVYANDFEGSEEEVKAAFQKLLPNETDYVAKPSHMSCTKGAWIISYDKDSGRSRFSQTATSLYDDKEQEEMAEEVAESITLNFHEGPHDYESWLLKNVKPGAIVEERYTDFADEDAPPGEFCIFTIWGRVWVAQYAHVEDQNRWSSGFIFRNGTMTDGSTDAFPAWVDWPYLVEIAETLGANKDMFRTDIFVGVPAGVKSGKTPGERRRAIKYVVSESELHPTTIFYDDILAEEAARLWIAGYKMGIYHTVPNKEVPQEFIDTGGFLSADWNTKLPEPEEPQVLVTKKLD